MNVFCVLCLFLVIFCCLYIASQNAVHLVCVCVCNNIWFLNRDCPFFRTTFCSQKLYFICMAFEGKNWFICTEWKLKQIILESLGTRRRSVWIRRILNNVSICSNTLVQISVIDIVAIIGFYFFQISKTSVLVFDLNIHQLKQQNRHD